MTGRPRRVPTCLFLTALLPLILATACSDDSPPAPTSTAVPTATATPPTPATATSVPPTPTPEPVRLDILASRLAIPALDIDTAVQLSQTTPYTYVPPPGCPPRPQDTQTVTVPSQGVATPEDNLEGLENKAWIYGHSRWLGTPGLFLSLQEIDLGDEILIDGVDRATGAPVAGERFVVDGIYLTDVDSGETLINAEGAADVPTKPTVILQTSVREDGAGKQWILDQASLLAKASNLVEGDLNDHCKYLLLFVTALAS